MLRRLLHTSIVVRKTPKQLLKDYVFPEVKKGDCELSFIKGWGPGGQCVNKARNAAQLRHVPTGIVVKIHESRQLLTENSEIAYERMKFALDRHHNGDECYEAQLARLMREREQKANALRRKRREMRQQLSDQDDKRTEKPEE